MDTWTLVPTCYSSHLFFAIFSIGRLLMDVFCRSGLVLQLSLRGRRTKHSCPAVSCGLKMLLIICNPFLMNFSQEIIPILLYTAEIDLHKCLILGRSQHQQSLMVRSLPCILNGGIWHVCCNGTMQKGCFFLLLSLIGFWINYRYYFAISVIFVSVFKLLILRLNITFVILKRLIKRVGILCKYVSFHSIWF